jgi:CRISPR-associated protein Csb2
MIGLSFELLARRVHATPWDAHVNEGQVEWPPSPWRLLRALVAASFRLPERNEAAVRALVSKLADEPPAYQLPPVTFAHTRAYLPQRAPGSTSLVFDAFAVTNADREPPRVWVWWSTVVLTPDERALLEQLAERVSYLGRAESWVQVAVVDAVPEDPAATSAVPDPNGEIAVWSLCSEAAYQAWFAGFRAGGGRAKDVPADRFAALSMETSRLHKERWSEPPGVQRVAYRLSAGSLPRRRTAGKATAATLARYAVSAAVLPPIRHTADIADRLRRALMARSRREDGSVSALFLGRDAQGAPLRGQQHAYFLPCDDDGDGHIDHLLVWSPPGFPDPDAARALQSLTHIWADADAGEDGRYALALVGLGDPATFGTVDAGTRHPARSATLGRSRVWVSETPFVTFRHQKVRGGRVTDSVEDQVRAAIRHLPHLAEGGEPEVTLDPRPFRGFRIERRGGGSRGHGPGTRVLLRFSNPVSGPLALGYGAHFGLGLFRAQAE